MAMPVSYNPSLPYFPPSGPPTAPVAYNPYSPTPQFGSGGLDATRFSGQPGDRAAAGNPPRFGCLGAGIGEFLLGCCGCCVLPIVGAIGFALYKIAKAVK